MKILLTSHAHPDSIGGTQSWTQTVAAELSRRGHYCFWYSAPNTPASTRYDLAIVSQNDTFPVARSVAKRVVYVSHGLGDLEKPPPGADAYAFVSEESMSHWDVGDPRWFVILDKDDHAVPHAIIRQPIDTGFWHPDPDATPNTEVLRVSPYDGLVWLPYLLEEMQVKSFYHATDFAPRTLRYRMRRAAVVLATGRSALEAMACGCEVILVDERIAGEPMLEAELTSGPMLANYSARTGVPATAASLMSVLTLCPRGGGEAAREWVVEHHAVEKIVDELLELLP